MAAEQDMELFEWAAGHLKTAKVKLSDKEQLSMYALYKQGTVGPCNTPRPGMLDFVGKAKWDAWKALGDLEGQKARSNYVAKVDDYCKVVSSEQDGSTTDVCYFAAINDAVAVRKLLDEGVSPDWTDDEGQTGLHFAADRGHMEIMKMLIGRGACVNLKEMNGQTCLHYACAAGNLDACQLLKDAGADLSITDEDGLTAAQVADDDEIKALLA